MIIFREIDKIVPYQRQLEILAKGPQFFQEITNNDDLEESPYDFPKFTVPLRFHHNIDLFARQSGFQEPVTADLYNDYGSYGHYDDSFTNLDQETDYQSTLEKCKINYELDSEYSNGWL